MWVPFVAFHCVILLPRTDVARAAVLVLFLSFDEQLQLLVLAVLLAMALLWFTVLNPFCTEASAC